MAGGGAANLISVKFLPACEEALRKFWKLCRLKWAWCKLSENFAEVGEKGWRVGGKARGTGLAGRFIWGRNSGVEIWEVGIWEVVAPRGVWWRVGFSLLFAPFSFTFFGGGCCWSVKLDVVQTFWNLCRGCGKGAGVLKEGAGNRISWTVLFGQKSESLILPSFWSFLP